MIISNPVRGTIHPKSWARPAGSLEFKLTQPFGCTGNLSEPPYGSCEHFHRGIDLGNGQCGSEVIAVASGTVTLAGPDPDSGNALRVVIAHPGGWFSLYYHLEDFIVRAGQAVVAGQLLGYVGKTGWADACHLHFELHADSDRLSFFDPWPQLAQNVTIRPKGAGINIRSSAGSGTLVGPLYATTKADGRIHRASDGADLGATASWRKWGGIVAGATVTLNGVTSNRWERIQLGAAYQYIWSPLSQRSAS